MIDRVVGMVLICSPCLLTGCQDADLKSGPVVQLAFTKDAKYLLVVNDHNFGGQAAYCSRLRSFSTSDWQGVADTGELDIIYPMLALSGSDACIFRGNKHYRKGFGSPTGGLLYFAADPRKLDIKYFDPAGLGNLSVAIACAGENLLCVNSYTTADFELPFIFDIKAGKKTVELENFPTKRKELSEEKTCANTLVEFTGDGKQIVSSRGCKPYQLQLHAADTGKLVASLKLESPVGAMRWSPNGKMLAALCLDGRLLLFDRDLQNKSNPLTLAENNSRRESLTFVGNEYLAIIPDLEDGQIKLYDTKAWKLRHTFEKRGNWVNCATGSADGKWLAAGFGIPANVAGSVCVWDVATKKLVKELK